MTPEQFVSKWANTTLSEKASAHEHFIDLCNLIGHPTPASDPTGQDYTFEKPVHPAAASPACRRSPLRYRTTEKLHIPQVPVEVRDTSYSIDSDG